MATLHKRGRWGEDGGTGNGPERLRTRKSASEVGEGRSAGPLPVGPIQKVGLQLALSLLWPQLDGRRTVQDGAACAGSVWLVLHGHGGLGVLELQKKVLRMEPRHPEPDGPGT